MITKEKEIETLKDKIATILFTDKETREYTESVIAASIGVPKEIVKDNLVLLTPRVSSTIKKQYSEVDALYENNTSIINIEINYMDYKTLSIKNMKYVCHLFVNQIEIGKKYSNIKPIYQININNFDVFKANQFIYKSSLMEETLHKRRNDYLNIIDINIDFLKKMDYTEIMEEEEDSLERLLYIFVCNDRDKLDKLYSGDDIMDKVREKISALTEDVFDELYYNREELIKEGAFEKGKEEGINEGINQGITQGIQQKSTEITKKMLEMNMSIIDICKITGLSEEEIENLK